jgi:hypothetical protein
MTIVWNACNCYDNQAVTSSSTNIHSTIQLSSVFQKEKSVKVKYEKTKCHVFIHVSSSEGWAKYAIKTDHKSLEKCGRAHE